MKHRIQFLRRRRDFIILLGGVTAPSGLWPLPLHAQTAVAVRRVGLLSPLIETTDETRRLSAVLTAGLNELGWTDGRNIHLEQRWSGGDNDRLRSDARELARLPAEVMCRVGQISAPHAAFTLRLRVRPSEPLMFEATSTFTVVTAR